MGTLTDKLIRERNIYFYDQVGYKPIPFRSRKFATEHQNDILQNLIIPNPERAARVDMGRLISKTIKEEQKVQQAFGKTTAKEIFEQISSTSFEPTTATHDLQTIRNDMKNGAYGSIYAQLLAEYDALSQFNGNDRVFTYQNGKQIEYGIKTENLSPTLIQNIQNYLQGGGRLTTQEYNKLNTIISNIQTLTLSDFYGAIDQIAGSLQLRKGVNPESLKRGLRRIKTNFYRNSALSNPLTITNITSTISAQRKNIIRNGSSKIETFRKSIIDDILRQPDKNQVISAALGLENQPKDLFNNSDFRQTAFNMFSNIVSNNMGQARGFYKELSIYTKRNSNNLKMGATGGLSDLIYSDPTRGLNFGIQSKSTQSKILYDTKQYTLKGLPRNIKDISKYLSSSALQTLRYEIINFNFIHTYVPGGTKLTKEQIEFKLTDQIDAYARIVSYFRTEQQHNGRTLIFVTDQGIFWASELLKKIGNVFKQNKQPLIKIEQSTNQFPMPNSLDPRHHFRKLTNFLNRLQGIRIIFPQVAM